MNSSADAILERLDPEQRNVATALTGPVCVLAGAGTGKTRAITHRIAYGVQTGAFRPTSVLAVTFTARAAGEMRERLRGLGVQGVQARTFHAAALRQLMYFLPRAEGKQVPRLVSHKAGPVAQAAARLGMEVDRAAVRDLAAEIEWAKVMLLTSEDYREKAGSRGREGAAGYDVIAVSRLMDTYAEVMTESKSMDFEDVLIATAGLLATHSDVREEIRRQYRHFVVDEYQDVSPLQQRLLEMWLGERQELCVVGDPHQTIYSFAGATPGYLTNFMARYPEATTVRLYRDYRSTPQVVALANSVIGAAPGSGTELEAQLPPGPAVQFSEYSDDEAEAAAIVRRIGELVAEGEPESGIAILTRTNGQSEPFESALAQAGTAYQIRGAARYFSRREVREAIMLLRAAAQGDQDGSLENATRELLRPVGWSETPPRTRGAARERWESLDALVRLGDQLAAGGASTLHELVAELEQRANSDFAPEQQGVTIASLHSAKGLEWNVVFLAGLNEGLMPISLAEGPEAIAEEKRLLYVGITRAKTRLFLSYTFARSAGRTGNRKVSRFLNGVWPHSELVRSGKKKKNSLKPEDRPLFEELRQWRAEIAKATSKPAFTVLTDVTLAAAATSRPLTISQLAQLPGIGPVKLETYGQDVLRIIENALGAENTRSV